ncbi:PBP1A family penicillin-binding protein [Chloroflexi bacterium TSY]|nr:PBP1A family penicillin-binding protein [Chloroflexi bacterium TSY]
MSILKLFTLFRLLLILFFVSSLIGCAAQAQIGDRPTNHLLTAVEAYLQQYQPGPQPRLFQTTILYDRHGELIAEFYAEGRRTWVSLSNVSQHLIDATIATEDDSFYQHTGVDLERVVGAVIQNTQNQEIVSGASTITMQLARNLFMGWEQRYEQSLDRKIQEAGIAQELTDLFTKNEILEIYLNLLNYGNLNYGPEAASQFYFGKSAADLNLGEATLLAGIPQSPARLDPVKNIHAVKQRQRIVLNLMVRHGQITEEQANDAYEQPLLLQHTFADAGTVQPLNRAPHFTHHVLELLKQRLGKAYVERAGLRIFTTLDLKMQDLAQQIVAEQVTQLQPTYDLGNAALVALKPGTAEVLAMVGSADYHNDAIAGQVNVATSRRQPGSTIKPLIYAAAIDAELIDAQSILEDEPITYQLPNGQTYSPQNYDKKYYGSMTVRTALANSFNIPAVKVLDAYGVEEMVPQLRTMGLRRSLDQEDSVYGLSLALGSSEVTLLELSGGFHTLANSGRYLEPRTIRTIIDPTGRSALEQEPSVGEQVLSPQTAFTITDILSDSAARRPMFGTNSNLDLSRPAAAKTGTTTDWRDNWTMGYTRYLLVGVWAGNTDGRPTRGSTGLSGAAPIWKAFMEAVLDDAELLSTLDASDQTEAWEFRLP